MSSTSDAELADRLSRAVDEGTEAVEAVLADLLAALDGGAVGLWLVVGENLECAGFAAHAGMAAEVAKAFREATATVPRSRVDLGIGQAVASGEPTIAHVEAPEGPLAGSASWLERFGAVSSLSVPFPTTGERRGVLAVSSAETFTLASGNGPRLLAIADALRIPGEPESR